MLASSVPLVLSAAMLVHAAEGFRIHPATVKASAALPTGATGFRVGFDLHRDDAPGGMLPGRVSTRWLTPTDPSQNLEFELDATGDGGAFWTGKRLEFARGGADPEGTWESRLESPVPVFGVRPGGSYSLEQAKPTLLRKLTLAATWTGCTDVVSLQWSYVSVLAGGDPTRPGIRAWKSIRIGPTSTTRSWNWELPRAESMGGLTSIDALDLVASCGDLPATRPVSRGMRRLPDPNSEGWVTIPSQAFDFSKSSAPPALGGIQAGAITFLAQATPGVPLYTVATQDGRSGIMHLSRSEARTTRYFDPLTSAAGKDWDGSQAHFVWTGAGNTVGRTVERFFRPVVGAPADATGYSANATTPGAQLSVVAEFLDDDVRGSDPFQYRPTGLRLDYRRVATQTDGGEYGRTWGADGQKLSLPVRRDGRLEWGRSAPLRVAFQITETKDVWNQASSTTRGWLDVLDPPVPDGDPIPDHSREAGTEAAIESSFRVPSGAVTFIFSTVKGGGTFQDPEVLVYPASEQDGTAPIATYRRILTPSLPPKAAVTAVVVPGTWDFVGKAQRGGRRVVFGRVRKTIKAGDRLLLDFGAPDIVVEGAPEGACIGDQNLSMMVRSSHEDLGIASIAWRWSSSPAWQELPVSRTLSTTAYEASSAFTTAPPEGGKGVLQVRSANEEGDEGVVEYAVEVDQANPPRVEWNGWTPPPTTAAVRLPVQGKAIPGSNGVQTGVIQRWAGSWVDAAVLRIGSDGVFAGEVPMKSGLNRFRVALRDRCGHEGFSEEFSVVSTNQPPVAVLACSDIQRKAAVGKSLVLQASATDPDNDPLDWSWSVNGRAIDATTAQATWFVGSSDPFQVRACATDPLGQVSCALCDGEPGSGTATMDCDLDPEGCGDDIHAPVDGPPFQGAMWNADPTHLYGLLKFCPNKQGGELPIFETERFLYMDLDQNPSTGWGGFETRWSILYLRKSDARSPLPLELRQDRWSDQGWVPDEATQEGAPELEYQSNGLRNSEPWMEGAAGPWELLEFRLPRPAGLTRLRWFVDAPGYVESRDGADPYTFVVPTETPAILVDGRTCDWMGAACSTADPIFGFEDPDLWMPPFDQATTIASKSGDVSTKTDGDKSLKLVTSMNGEAMVEATISVTDALRCAEQISFDLKLPKMDVWWDGQAYVRVYSNNATYYQDPPRVDINRSEYDGKWHRKTITLPKGVLFPIGTLIRLQLVLNVNQGSLNLDNLVFSGTRGCIEPPTQAFPLSLESATGLVAQGGATLTIVDDHSEGTKSLKVDGGSGERGFAVEVKLPSSFTSDQRVLVDVKLPAGEVSWTGALVLRETVRLSTYQEVALTTSQYNGTWQTIALPLDNWKDHPGEAITLNLTYNGPASSLQFDQVRIAVPPPPPPPVTTSVLLSGFESLSGLVAQGGATLTLSTVHSEGTNAIQVTGANSERGPQITVTLPTAILPTSIIKLDVHVPATANPGWAGYLALRGAGPAYDARQADLVLTDYTAGGWKTLSFPAGAWSDLKGTELKLNVLYNGPASTVHFDNFRIE